jgi:hypothetical protein
VNQYTETETIPDDERHRYYEEANRAFVKRWNKQYDEAVLKAFEDAAA